MARRASIKNGVLSMWGQGHKSGQFFILAFIDFDYIVFKKKLQCIQNEFIMTSVYMIQEKFQKE